MINLAGIIYVDVECIVQLLNTLLNKILPVMLIQKFLRTYFVIALLGIISFSCSQRAQCPAYERSTGGTVRVFEKGGKTPGELRKQSLKILDKQQAYIRVKRDKRTGLVKKTKRLKRRKGKKNKTRTHRGFKKDPRSNRGLRGY